MMENTVELTSFNRTDETMRLYKERRRFLIELMKKLKEKLKFRSQTLFLAIYYMDIIYSNSSIDHNQLMNSSELIAISTIQIAAKFDENDPDIPAISQFQTIFSKINDLTNFFTLDEIKKSEIDCLIALDYKLNYFSVYHFLVFFITHGIITDDEVSKFFEKENIEPSKEVSEKIVEKIYAFSREILDIVIDDIDEGLISFKNYHIALSIIFYAKDFIFKFEEDNFNRNKYLPSVYGIEFEQIQESYNRIIFLWENYYNLKNSSFIKKKKMEEKKPERKMPMMEHRLMTKASFVDSRQSATLSSKLLKIDTLKYEKTRPNLNNAPPKSRAVSSQKNDRKIEPRLFNKLNETKFQTIDQQGIIATLPDRVLSSSIKTKKNYEIQKAPEPKNIKKNSIVTTNRDASVNKKLRPEPSKNFLTLNKSKIDDKKPINTIDNNEKKANLNYSKDPLKASQIYSKDPLKASQIYSKDPLKASQNFSKDTLKASQNFSKDTLKSSQKDPLRSSQIYSKETLKGNANLSKGTLKGSSNYSKEALKEKLDKLSKNGKINEIKEEYERFTTFLT